MDYFLGGALILFGALIVFAPSGAVASIGVIIHGWGAVGRPDYSLGYIDLMVFIAMLPMILVAAPLGAKTSNAVSQKWLKWMYTLLLFVIAANMTYHMLG